MQTLLHVGSVRKPSHHWSPFPSSFSKVFSGWGLMYFPHHDISFDGNWFLRIMVKPIVFEAALSIDKRSFNRHGVPILLYAVLGTLLATGLTAVVVHEGSKYLHEYCETIPFIEALTFGALISSIDPIAVLSVLSNIGMTDTDTIYVVIFG
jgi:NhaP-type Na+/H+ or K+/H+ antiporter